jgi:hypothetical protein
LPRPVVREWDRVRPAAHTAGSTQVEEFYSFIRR